MTETLQEIVNDLGAELFGATWTHFKPIVQDWFQHNPRRVEHLRQRLHDATKDGGPTA